MFFKVLLAPRMVFTNLFSWYEKFFGYSYYVFWHSFGWSLLSHLLCWPPWLFWVNISILCLILLGWVLGIVSLLWVVELFMALFWFLFWTLFLWWQYNNYHFQICKLEVEKLSHNFYQPIGTLICICSFITTSQSIVSSFYYFFL